jgi:uncharacterized protein (DUF885 family)
MRRTTFALSVALIALMPIAAPSFAQSSASVPKPAVTQGEKLKKLFFESDEANLKRNPISAMFRGDPRYADQLGDFITPAYFNAERAVGKADLKALMAIDRNALNATDKIAYDVFKWQTELGLRGLSPQILPLTVVRPIDHFSGFHTFYPDVASGQGAAPFKTLVDYDNNLKRHREFIVLMDRSIGRMREGMRSGVVQPKLTIRNVIEQLDLQLKQPAEESPYYGPIKAFPESISESDKARLKQDYAATIKLGIFPAYKRMRDFLQNEYLPKSREGVGLVHMKGGLKLYSYMIESSTTVKMTPDAVHDLGLSEVARVRAEMEAIKDKLGFKGELGAFFTYYRTEPKFKYSSREDMRDSFYAIGKTVDLKVRDQFSTIPKTPLEIRPVPDYKEKTDAGGSYQSGTPDGSRPGIFYFNAYDLPSRSKPGSETLFLHEAVPGHHFQISLAQENAELPSFMRFGGNTAYVEGWALYAESLWKELGVESDPAYRFGGLNDEMLRAMRLVVDSGLHAKGWTRDQAIKYMLDNSGMSANDARAEVERYIAIPSQALAYKIGQLTILRLKAKAKATLGDKFDPRAFHAQVLMTGALPMTVLEKKIDDWIAGGGK